MHNRRRQHDAATAVQWEVKQFLRDVLRILVLLWQWVPLNEMACLIQSLMHARASNLFAAVQGDAAAVMCAFRRGVTLSAPWFRQTSVYFKISGRRATVHG